MSFGFSISDFITLVNLVTEAANIIRKARQADQEYVEVLSELECFGHMLQHLDDLQVTNLASSARIQLIKQTALSCRRPIEDFLRRTRKYGKTLGFTETGQPRPYLHTLKALANRLRWTLREKKPLERLRLCLGLYIAVINLQLAQHRFDAIDGALAHLKERQGEVEAWSKNVGRVLAKMEAHVHERREKVTRTDRLVNSAVRIAFEVNSQGMRAGAGVSEVDMPMNDEEGATRLSV